MIVISLIEYICKILISIAEINICIYEVFDDFKLYPQQWKS